MRVYVGERSSGEPRVWLTYREPLPDLAAISSLLAELRQLTVDVGRPGPDHDQRRADFVTRKKALIARIEAAERVPNPVPLTPYRVQSPDGFEWGYQGSGPAELAFSILNAEIGEPPPHTVYLAFRDAVVSGLPKDRFELRADEVWAWIEANRELVQRELFDQLPPTAPAMAVVDRASEGMAKTPEPSAATASALVAACEAAWSSIQRHHPDLPDVVMVLGTGVERGRLVKLGHWWGGRWLADGQARGEVLLAGEALHLPPTQVFEVLLHEAAHGLNAARGIKDTSRGGRYHNNRFAAAAREVLLTVRAMPPYGLASTSLSVDAEARYAQDISVLGDAMRIARQLERGIAVGEGQENGRNEGGKASGSDDDRRRSTSVAASCACGRKLRMAPSVYAAGPVVCGVCGADFQEGADRRHAVDRASHPDGEAIVDRTFLERRSAALGQERSASWSRSFELQRQRARLEAALSLAPNPADEVLVPLHNRIRRIDALVGPENDEAVAPTATQAEAIDELLRVSTTSDDRRVVGSWYERVGTIDETPMPASDVDELARRSQLARALLKADGTLTEPRLEHGATEVMRGDRLVAAHDLDFIGLSAGVSGTVDGVDPAVGEVDIDFATWGRLRAGLADVIDRHLRHDYAEISGAASGPEPPGRALDREAGRLLPEVEW